MFKDKIEFGMSMVLSVALIASLAVGCGPAATPKPAPSPTPAAITLTDDAGRTVKIPPSPKRIISLAPSNTELIFALGLGEKVVGVSDFTTYPPEAAKIDSVGGMPLNFEKIVALNPDLILAAGLTSKEDLGRLEGLGKTVLVLDPKDIEGVLANITLMGKAVGLEAKAEALVSSLRKDWEGILAKTKAAKERPKVFVELDETLFTIAPGSFIHPLIEMAGGTNIAADVSGNPYPQFSSEQVIQRNPQVIILTDHGIYGGVTPDKVKARPGWQAIDAVKNGAIYPIDPDVISRPGPRVIQGLEALAKLIHPELWK